MAKNSRKKVELTVEAQTKQAMESIQELDKMVQALAKDVGKVMAKGSHNNGVVSSKDTTNIRNAKSEVDAYAQSMQKLQKQLDQLGAKDVSKTLGQFLSSPNINFKKGTVQPTNTRTVGRGNNRREIDYNQAIKEVLSSKYTERPNKAFSENNPYRNKGAQNAHITKVNEERGREKADLRDLSSSVNNTRGSARRTAGRIDTSIGTGYLTYNRNQEYGESFKQGRNRISRYQEDIKDKTSRYNSRIRDYQESNRSIDSRVKAGQSTKADNVERNLNNQRIKELNDNISKLKEFSRTLEDSEKTISDSERNLGQATRTGAARVGKDRNTFAGRLEARQDSIAIASATSMSANAHRLFSSGAQTRKQMEQYVDPIMYQQAQSGKDFKGRPDKEITRNLENLGQKNGTGYSGSQMAQFANYATGGPGNQGNYSQKASAWSKFGRYSGVGAEGTLALEQAISEAGAGRGNPANLTKSIQDSIAGSRMTRRASEQAQAITDFAQSNATNGGVSNKQIKNFAAIQGQAAQYGSEMQGNAFNQNMQAIQQGAGNFNDPVARAQLVAKNGSQKYAGINGAFQMRLDMENQQKNPGKFANSVLKFNGGDKTKAALSLVQQTGMSAHAAKDMVDMASKGQLTDKGARKIQAKYAGSSDKNEEAYQQSGIKTLNDKEAQQERNGVYASQSGDSFRKAGNAIFRDNPYGGMLSEAVGTTLGSVMFRKVLPLGTRGLARGTKALGRSVFGGGKHGGGGLLSKVKAKYPGAVKKFTKSSGSHGTSFAERMRGWANSSTKASKASEGVADASKVAEAGSRTASVTKAGVWASKGIRKGSSLLRGAGKVAGKVAGKAAAPLALLSTGIDVYSALKDSKKGTKDRHKKVGGAIGSGVGGFLGGMGAGALAGSAFGPVGTIVGGIGGAIVGSTGGKKLGEWAGGLTGKNSKKAKDKKDQTGEAKKADTKSHGLIKEGKSLLKGFNDMLDKAHKVIMEARSIKSGDDDSGGNVEDTNSPGGSGVERWRGKIKEVAKKMGQNVTDKEVAKILRVIKGESGGNETIVNTTDRNAKAGHPSKGLLQYVQSTFDHYAVKGHKNINSGTDQLYALFNDTDWRNDLTEGGWSPNGKKGSHAHGGISNHAHGGLRKHARGGISSKATIHGDDMFGEQGPEAYVPLGRNYKKDGQRMLDQISPSLGRISLTPSSVKSLANSGGANVNISPNNNVHITVSGGTTTDIAQGVRDGIGQSNQDLARQLNQYFSNAF